MVREARALPLAARAACCANLFVKIAALKAANTADAVAATTATAEVEEEEEEDKEREEDEEREEDDDKEMTV